jgi:hypothetical protein
MHATPKSAFASTVAVDLAKDVFELPLPMRMRTSSNVGA